MIYYIGEPRIIPSEAYKEATMEELLLWLEGKIIIQVDTETEGWFDFINKVLTLQIGNNEDQWVINTQYINCNPLKTVMENSSIIKILHNAKFDYKFIKFHFGWELKNIYDTFLAECTLTNGIVDRKVGLKDVAFKYLGVVLDKTVRGKMNNKGLTDEVIIYAATDVKHLENIMKKQLILANQEGLVEAIQLENEVTDVLADIEYNGIALNTEKWLALAEKAEVGAIDGEKILDVFVRNDAKLQKYVKDYIQVNLFDFEERDINIKWSSPTQTLRVFKDLGLNIDDTLERSIKKYENTHPLIKNFIDYKKNSKLATTYGIDFLKFINKKSGRIHQEIWQILETHRISSAKPNMQQLPAKEEYLACFEAPNGFKIVGADYSGQELRLITEGSKDPIWQEAFNKGEDLHGKIASMLFKIPLDQVKEKLDSVGVAGSNILLRGKSPRDVTKTINFMLAYGGSEYKLADTLSIKPEEAKAIIAEYFKAVPKVKEFLEGLAKYGLKHQCMRSFRPYSIKRHLKYNKWIPKEVGETARAAKNTYIQASGAMMTKLALIELKKAIKLVPYHVEIILQIHDAIYCYVEEKYAEEWAEIQRSVMIKAGQKFIKSVPIIVDCKITNYWSK